MNRKARREAHNKAAAEIQRQDEHFAFMRGVQAAYDGASFGFKVGLAQLPEYCHTHTASALDAFTHLDRCVKLYTTNEETVLRLQRRIEELTPLTERIRRKKNIAKVRLRNAKRALKGQPT